MAGPESNGAHEWGGDSPYFLLVVGNDTPPAITEIDVDERGWHARHADLMRAPGTWYLVDKATNVVKFGIRVYAGEQPYYTARHVGIASAVTGERRAEVIAFGIGKKRADGHVDRLWVLPNGLICAGDDVDDLAVEVIKRFG